jgi:transglutaminase superfamily protein/transglutaminase TgpA-like protein
MAEPIVSRLTVALLVVAFSAWHWARLERPVMDSTDVGVLCALTIVPGLVWALRRSRIALAAAVALSIWGAVWTAFGYQPWERNHPFYPRRIYDGIRDGAHSWFDTVTPFDPGRFPSTGALVELSFFALAVVFAWLLLDGRFAVLAVATAFALFAIPSTAGSFNSPGLRAALFLALAVAVLAVTQLREPLRGAGLVQLTALGVAAVICGLVVGGAPAVAKGAFFDWRNWNPMAGDGPRADVAYVWDQNYGPLKWPTKKLTMFEVDSPRPLYWKAGVLTEFDIDRWKASPLVQAPFPGTDLVGLPETILPPKATRPDHRGDVIVSSFKIKGLADRHLLTAGQALNWSLDRTVDAVVNTDGSVELSRDPSRNQEYDARSYSPDPSPTQLVKTEGLYPGAIASGVTVNGRRVPVWGSVGGVPAAMFEGILDPRLLRASDDAWKQSGARGAATQYGAVIALESYLRSDPFTYDPTPTYKGDMPVLAEFLLTTHEGYCQMYSGAMAFVLRMHGIPARVAVGFTEGTQSRADHYVVKDRNAHAWVETYFPGYGWVPFEPTPGRALQLLASTSNTGFSNNFQGLNPNTTLTRLGFLPSGALLPGALGLLLKAGGPIPAGQRGDFGLRKGRGGAAAFVDIPSDSGSNRGSFVAWALTAVAVVVAALAGLKFAAVRWRYLRRGPRGQASAAFHELSTYLGDQGVPVPQNATFEELAALVRKTWGIDASALATAGSAARYAPPTRAARAGREVRPQLRRVKRELRRNVSRGDRAGGALRLRSALSQTTHLD